MQQYILSHASNPDWQVALQQTVQQAQTNSAINVVTLGFVYVTAAYEGVFKKIVDELEKAFPQVDWVGTIGQSICVTNIEYAEQPAMAILLTDIEKSSYTIFKEQAAITERQQDNDVQFGILHGDPRNPLLTEQLETFAETLEPSYFVGGLTSANNYYYQYAGNNETGEIIEGGLSGIIFNNADSVMTGLTQGCSPISDVFTLTECEHHMAFSIDNRPALDVFKENIGEILARDINRAAGYIFAGFPVTGSDTGDYLIRNIIGIDPDNNFVAIADDLKVNSPIMFCKRDSQTAIDDLKRMLNTLKDRLEKDHNGLKPKGAFYISCLGRGQHMFGDVSSEIKHITDVLGDIPLIGFYANGEIAGHRLYGFTGVLTLFL